MGNNSINRPPRKCIEAKPPLSTDLKKRQSAIAFFATNAQPAKSISEFLTPQEHCELRFCMRRLSVDTNTNFKMLQRQSLRSNDSSEILSDVSFRTQLDECIETIIPKTDTIVEALISLSDHWLSMADNHANDIKQERMPSRIDGVHAYRKNALFLAALGKVEAAIDACNKALQYKHDVIGDIDNFIDRRQRPRVNSTLVRPSFTSTIEEIKRTRSLLTKQEQNTHRSYLSNITQLCEQHITMSRANHCTIDKSLLRTTDWKAQEHYPLNMPILKFYSHFVELYKQNPLSTAVSYNSVVSELIDCNKSSKKTISDSMLNTLKLIMYDINTLFELEFNLNKLESALNMNDLSSTKSGKRKIRAICALGILSYAKSFQNRPQNNTRSRTLLNWITQFTNTACEVDDIFTFVFREANNHANELMVSSYDNQLKPLLENDHQHFLDSLKAIETKLTYVNHGNNRQIHFLINSLKKCLPLSHIGPEYASDVFKLVKQIDSKLREHIQRLPLYQKNRYYNEAAFIIKQIASNIKRSNDLRYALISQKYTNPKRNLGKLTDINPSRKKTKITYEK